MRTVLEIGALNVYFLLWTHRESYGSTVHTKHGKVAS